MKWKYKVKNYYYVIFLTVLLVFLNIFYVFKISNVDSECISLIIPSTNISWNKCRNQIEYMICKSVEKPQEVLIIVSGTGIDKSFHYTTFCKYNLRIYYRRNNMNSASNKNFGTRYAKCLHISFFDADDIMSNNRIKILKYIIKEYKNYDIILHMYTRNYIQFKRNVKYSKNISKYFYLNSSYITSLYRKNIHLYKVQLWGCCHFLPKQYHISNGWITVKKSMFNVEKFNEDISLTRTEDSEYNGRVIMKGYKALILRMILGYYSKQNDCKVLDI